MVNLNELVLEDKEVTVVSCKNRLGLRTSSCTVPKYLRRLSWKKRSSIFCQYVSMKNRIERVIVAIMYLTSGLNFDMPP
jgi:hypothetical protein